MKYLVRQPATLQNLAMDQLGQWIASQSSTLMSARSNTSERDPAGSDDALSRAIEVIRDYLQCALPRKFYDKLATVFISLVERFFNTYHSTVIGRLIEILFTKNLRCLSLYEDDTEIFFPSLCSKSYLLSNLNELNLSNCRWSHDTDVVITKALQELHNLRYLTLRYTYKLDNILTCIADNCKLIEVLNLYSDENFVDSHFDILTRLSNLRRLEVHLLPRSKKIATLLMSCENLEHMQIPLMTLAIALEHMATFDQNKRLKLRSYVNGHGSTVSLQQLQLVVEMCPNIQEMSLEKDEHDQIDLTPLKNLQYLRKLTLKGLSFRSDHVDELLHARGSDLIQLRLEHVSQVDLYALICISQMCPNLESLSMSYCNYETTYESFYPMVCPCLQNLKTLSLEATFSNVALPSRDQLLFFLLSNCINIENIYTYKVPLSDAFWLQVLDRNPLMYLKELKLYKQDPPPSARIIDSIVQNSINSPEVVISLTS